MIVHRDVVQGGKAWLALRIGLPTGSGLHRLLTKTMKPSASADDYLAELVTEWALGVPMDSASSAFMERGKELEAEARAWYEFERDVKVESVGFITNDEGTIGCSPDGLVGEDGLIEIKCYEAKHHVAELIETDTTAHRQQIQGMLMITGRSWCDRIFYNPVLPTLVVRIVRDEAYIQALWEQAIIFSARLVAAKQRMLDLGFKEIVKIPATCHYCKSDDDVQTSDHLPTCGKCRKEIQEIFAEESKSATEILG